jgi:alkyl hydroperoxide reductase subunit F
MLTPDILNALKGYTADMSNSVTLVLQTGEHEKRAELLKFLKDFAGVSDKISVEERDTAGVLRSPISFMFEVDGTPNGIVFSGIPGGHEFNSMVLGVLHSSGTALKLDDSIQNIVKSVGAKLKFEVFVSLSCHNCPDVVQALNQFAVLNENISTETIDGGLYKELIAERNIQGVPTVFLNGEVFANGKIDTAQLLEKLMGKYPDILENVANTAEQLPLQDITVIGGGPAGISAAIYAARKGLNVTVIADRVGGQVKDTMGIENLISVSKTTGPELTNALLSHLNDYEVTLKEHLRVDKIEDGDTKKVMLSSGEVIETKTVILATGAKWRELGIPGEKENIGNGVAYCPHCDGPFFKVKSVTVLEFLPELKADKVLVDQAGKRNNITIMKNVASREVVAKDGKVTGLEYTDRASDAVKVADVDGIFVQIGLLPNSGFVKDLVELSPYGEIVINEKCETNIEGIYACGDVTTVPYKQIVISMGEGSKAALTAFEYLLKK